MKRNERTLGTEPLSTQEVFTLCISEGKYTNDGIEDKSSSLMCIAIAFAYMAGLITAEECDTARADIAEYLDALDGEGLGGVTLAAALRRQGLPHTFPDRLAIYKDWANRPMPRGAV